MKKLVIDIGNTLSKIAIFDASKIENFQSTERISINGLKSILSNNSFPEFAIISSVKSYPFTVKNFLKSHCNLFELNYQTALPIKITYTTPQTLGNDRIASAVAGQNIYPYQNVLVINAGTCITYDFVNKEGEYEGGAISPGLEMRFKAMHKFTGKLPLIDKYELSPIIGKHTVGSMVSGVINGITYEMDGFIEKYNYLYPDLKVILSGGTAKYFDKSLKNSTFAIENIVMQGLNIILDYNAEKYS